VKSSTQVDMTGTYMVMPRFGLETSLTTPFPTKVRWRESDPPDDDLRGKAKVDIDPWVFNLGVGFKF